MRRIYWGGIALLTLAAGCLPDNKREVVYTNDQCGPNRYVVEVYNGTSQPSHVPLSDGQIMAIGTFGGCTGTLITGNWVLTAGHCNIATNRQFCIGPDPKNANVCAKTTAVYDHPERDVTLVQLDKDMRDALPGVTPLSILTNSLKSDMVGQYAEAAGYGLQENGQSGEREFTREPIRKITDKYIVVDGEGDRGLCFGDSGGPVLVISAQGPRVGGALSNGDASCLGIDNYARVDVIADWVQSYVGPMPGNQGCGGFDAVGRCFPDGEQWLSAYCGDKGQLVTENCDTCGWDEATQGYRCITGEDPCAGVDSFGQCSGNTARWCQDGELKERDCGCAQTLCEVDGALGGAFCKEDPCQGLTYLGECDGNVAQWCERGEIVRRDCGGSGMQCGFVGDDIGYYCVPE